MRGGKQATLGILPFFSGGSAKCLMPKELCQGADASVPVRDTGPSSTKAAPLGMST